MKRIEILIITVLYEDAHKVLLFVLGAPNHGNHCILLVTSRLKS